MTTNPDLDQAREWAEYLTAQRAIYGDKAVEARAAARTIQSLPDEWVDADKLREVIEEARLLIRDGEPEIILNDLNALLPAPAPRTLADMTPEEQEACRFMAAEVATGRAWYIIGRSPGQYGQWIVVTRSGRIEARLPEHIVPLPDLPRLEWPASGQGAAEREMPGEKDPWWIMHEYRVSGTEIYPDPPRPEDVPEGEVWMIRDNNGTEMTAMKLAREAEMWDWVTTGGQYRADRLNFYKNKAVTLVSRLVPEVKA